MKYSVVVPVYNEAGNIENLDRELKEVLASLGESFEILYVNDGSTDGSMEELERLPGATIIELNRNYGQAVALDAGFKAAAGELIISLDGDGQNDPADIPTLIQKLHGDTLDVVAGWRKKRMDARGISILTVVGRFMRRVLIKDVVHDTGCTLRVYTKEAVKSLDIDGEMHRYILSILRWKGFRIGEVIVNHRAREHGVSKYTYTKAIRGFIDLIGIWFIEKYSQRPLHLFGYLSLGAFFIGAVSAFWTIYGKLFLDLSINRNGWTFVAMFALLAGIMLFSFGLIIDLLIRIHLTNSPVEHRYYIRKVQRNEQ